MAQTSSYTLRLPMSLKSAVAEVSQDEGISINQFVTAAVAEKLAARPILLRDGGQPPDPEDRLLPDGEYR